MHGAQRGGAHARHHAARVESARRRSRRPARCGMMGRGGPGMALFMGKAQRARDTRGTLRRLWGYLARQRWG